MRTIWVRSWLALHTAMAELMDDQTQPDNAHPAAWAPFVVVGEGVK